MQPTLEIHGTNVSMARIQSYLIWHGYQTKDWKPDLIFREIWGRPNLINNYKHVLHPRIQLILQLTKSLKSMTRKVKDKMYRPSSSYNKRTAKKNTKNTSKKPSGHRNPKNALLYHSLPRSLSINKAQSQLAHLLPTTSKLDNLDLHRSMSPMSIEGEAPPLVTIPDSSLDHAIMSVNDQAPIVVTTLGTTNSDTNNPTIPTKKPCPKCEGLELNEQCIRKVEVHRRKNVQQKLSGSALTFAKEEERLPPLLVSFQQHHPSI